MDQPDNRAEISESIHSLPATDAVTELLSESAANAALFDMQSSGSNLPERLRNIVRVILDQAGPELERVPNTEYIAMSPDALTGLLMGAARRGAAQTAIDIGNSTREARAMELLLADCAQPDDV